jgi:hypothetical protein
MEEAEKATISRLLGIVGGKSPVPHGAGLVAQDVVIHMDRHTFHGINTWAAWITYLRTRSRVADLDVEVDRLVSNSDGTITAHGRWKARRRGEVVYSRDVWARYRVVDGIVAEIWTTRTNYAFMVGPLMRCCVGHLLIMLHVFFWARMADVPDLRTSPAAAAASTQALNVVEEGAGA